jgi:hypothetical protein
VYSHLGWSHVYPESLGYYGSTIYPNKTWEVRKKLLCDALGKIFDFSIFEGTKKNSLGALFYYVHILGDHEENTIGTAHTRIPIVSMEEQGTLPWDQDRYWVPESTIQDELMVHLGILFASQKHTYKYQALMNEIVAVNLFTITYISENTDEIHGFTSSETQKERAKYLLQILFDYCPYLLSRESFCKNFYVRYNIAVF